MRRFALLAAALAACALPVAAAQARTRTITVTPRSYLDPGNVVPVGTEQNYVYQGQYFERSPYFNQPFMEDREFLKADPRYGYGVFGPIDFSGQIR